MLKRNYQSGPKVAVAKWCMAIASVWSFGAWAHVNEVQRSIEVAQADRNPARRASPAAAAVAPKRSSEPAKVAVLRISCDGENKGADVTINGELKGSCPFDVQVPAGPVAILAVKKVDPLRERIFVDERTLGSDVVQRIEIVLGGRPRISPETRRRLDADDAEQLKAEERQRNELPRMIVAAEAGDTSAMYELARIYQWGNAGAVDFKKAVMWLDRASGAGHAPSMSAYAWLFNLGVGMPEESARAASLYLKAAELGDPRGMGRVGMAYALGSMGLAKDRPRGVEWLTKAVEKGDPISMISLANVLEDSPNRMQDAAALRSKAFPLMESRARAYDGEASSELLFMLSYVNVGGDRARLLEQLSWRKHRYQQKAAATGDPQSLDWLGRSYASGRDGAPRDDLLAEQFYREAINKGNKRAVDDLEYLLKKRNSQN